MIAEADGPTLLVTVTGPDRPGVTARLFDALAGTDVEVVDVEQVVVRGHLTLAVLVTSGPDAGQAMSTITQVGSELGLRVTCLSGHGDNKRTPHLRPPFPR